ncbi:glycoside hydrolase family 5 protein [Actinotalea subterranea]|uniref:glycoside hydrolase family 5 protein n=1 Tax=Actinotalea subterranea TaxID=2607497 RepID=UPI001FE92F02|nr:cellulase family glycosylhydrolase [Actinotalea subterranea]
MSHVSASTRPRTPVHAPSAFVRAEGGRLVGPDGEPLLLRGVGLGNWLLPEGYMWGFGHAAASPTQIEALVVDLVGEQEAAAFWRRFREVFVTQADVAQIARDGFDHVRLPINWRVLMTGDGGWREDGFALVERLVGWCRDAGLRVLLDLHGAPGGQTGTNIDDSDGRPALFMDPRNADLTVALWVELARRYASEPAVLGYDLLNEPLPNEWQHTYPEQLVALYRRITAAIRDVDPDHLIMYEGTHWATGWEIFTQVWDENSALQFHKYWSAADRPSIQGYVEVGRRLGLPVYMGEGGENTPEWLAAAHQLYEDHGIGWNFWPWKKIDTQTSPMSVRAPEGWDRVLAYADGRGPRPDRADAVRILTDLLDAMPAHACERREDVVHALFRRAPVTLPASAFTFRGAGASYGTTRAVPHPQLRPDDAVTLRRRDGGPDLGFEHPRAAGPEGDVVADLAPGDWLVLEPEVPAGTWEVVVLGTCGAPGAPGAVPLLEVDGVPIALHPAPAHATALDDAWAAPLTSPRPDRVALRVAAADGGLTLASVRVTGVAS